MRKLAPLLFALGAFLLVAGLVALVWAPGVVKKTPLDVDSSTRLEGRVEKLNVATGELEKNPVKAESVTKADSKNSTGSVVLFASSQCLVIDVDDAPDCVSGDDPRLVTASTDIFATDRKTALAVNSDKLPAGTETHSGVINKWPFDAEKKTYPYWDGVIADDVPATFDRTEKVRGLQVNVYKVSIQDAEVEIAKGVNGTYNDSKEIWVDPATGSIVNQIDEQQRYLANGDKVLDLQLAFTDKQVAANVKDAQDNASSLRLITFWVPVVGLVAGVLLLLAGVLLLRRSHPRGGAHAADSRAETLESSRG